MAETQAFLQTVSRNDKYQLQTKFGGEVVLITSRK